MVVTCVRFGLICGLLLMAAPFATSQALSLNVEAVRIPDVGSSWQTVPLRNTYTSPVVVCTYNLRTNADREATVRIRNTTANQFEVRAQRFEDSSAFTPSDVHCLIADEGLNTLADGRVIEARTVLSTRTAGNAVGWNGASNYTNVTAQVTGSHSSLVILGQVMTFNDNQASVFTSNNCSNRGTPATPSNICVTKHIGQINDTRLDETLGFIITEPGAGTVNDVNYAFARGSDTVRGAGNGPPYSYSVSGDFDTGIATLAAEDGGQGGWAVLYGSDPLPNNQINLAVDEETVAGDSSRSHTTEQVYYGIFDNNQTADLSVSKTTDLYSGTAVPFAVPGSDVIYTLLVESTGSAPIDEDTIFMVDTLGDQTTFYNGDIDEGGPETSAIAFQALSSGLTFDDSTDLAFSDLASRPTLFSDCTYTPAAGYDPAVRHICLNPKGALRAGTLEPNTDFSWSFRARVN